MADSSAIDGLKWEAYYKDSHSEKIKEKLNSPHQDTWWRLGLLS